MGTEGVQLDRSASTTGDGMSNCTSARVHMTKGQSSPVYKARVVAMNGVSIKELQMIPALMNMHPANVLLTGDDIGITSDVMITKEAAIALNCYINDPRQFDEAEQPA